MEKTLGANGGAEDCPSLQVSAKVLAFAPARNRRCEEETMPKYVIERDIPGIGDASRDQSCTISQKSCSVLRELGPTIQWLHSYVTADRIYCV
jgi:hypothetical protein